MPVLTAHQVHGVSAISMKGAQQNGNLQQSPQPRWVTARDNKATSCLHMHSQLVADYFSFEELFVIGGNQQEESGKVDRS